MKQNHDEIVHSILSAKLFNQCSGYDVDYDLVHGYLDLYPAKLDLGNRLVHFKQWLNGDFS